MKKPENNKIPTRYINGGISFFVYCYYSKLTKKVNPVQSVFYLKLAIFYVNNQ